MPRTIRRLVTGHDKQGKSILLTDAQADCVMLPLPQVPGLALINLWATQQSPVEVSPLSDPAADIQGLVPTTGGSIFRVVDFPPEAGYLDKVSAKLRDDAFTMMQANTCKDTKTPEPHPFMHRTNTVDYAMVLEGEIYLILDQSEHFMQAGDVAIQSATNHAWSNRSDKNCRIAFVLLNAQI